MFIPSQVPSQVALRSKENAEKCLSDSTTPAILHFCLSVMEDIESFPVLFQAERPYVFFIYEKLKELIWLVVTRFM